MRAKQVLCGFRFKLQLVLLLLYTKVNHRHFDMFQFYQKLPINCDKMPKNNYSNQNSVPLFSPIHRIMWWNSSYKWFSNEYWIPASHPGNCKQIFLFKFLRHEHLEVNAITIQPFVFRLIGLVASVDVIFVVKICSHIWLANHRHHLVTRDT